METKDSKELQFSFLMSFVLHVGVILAIYFLPRLVSLFYKNSNVEIIKSSIRVDVVGMPKFTINELKTLQQDLSNQETNQDKKGGEAPKEAKVEGEDIIKKDDLVIQEKSKVASKKSFLNILSNYSSKGIEVKKKSPSFDKSLKSNDLNSLVIEGNRLSKGTALTGDYSEQDLSEFSVYVQNLPEVIRKHWKLPSYLMNQGLKCRIKIFLSSTGKLIKLEVYESSGQLEFDSRAEDAIRKAAPYFPSPSTTVASRVSHSGIILGFPL